MNSKPPFIHSLHRPFSQQLKACKWVCVFLKDNYIKSSALNMEFYLYMIKRLEKEYKNFSGNELNGLPNREGIVEINLAFKSKSKEEQIIIVRSALNNTDREESTEKHIYNSYKAASYYINMTKEKLKLIDKRNFLTDKGNELTKMKSNFFTYSEKEKDFFFKNIIDIDFLLIISLCLFKKLGDKHKVKNYTEYQYDFLNKYYKIRYFKFTSKSVDNYNVVRNYWLNSLNVLDKNCFIKKSYLEYIRSNEEYNRWYLELNNNFDSYNKNYFKNMIQYAKETKKFEIQYEKCVKDGKADSGFVNLYDIKELMKISDDKFQNFIEYFYENEKRNSRIFFSNIVSSIDRRKRFEVRGIPVLKIKIKKN